MPRTPVHKFKALLLAGGTGSRLRPLTDEIPKCLVPIEENKPILDYWLETLEAAGITDVLINTHHHRERVVAYIRHINATRNFRIQEAYEPELRGSAGTITANRDWVEDAEHCIIIYADNLSTVELAPLTDFHLEHGDPCTMMLFRTERPAECGIAELDNDQRVISFIEKPANPKTNRANAGLYLVTADAFREMADLAAFDIGFEILPKFVGRMRGYDFTGYHRDIGNHDALAQARRDAPQIFPATTKLN